MVIRARTKNRDVSSVSAVSPDKEQDLSHVAKDGLLAKEGHLLRVLAAANIIPWEADAKTWIFTYVGSQAERILGYPLDQWYEKDFWTSHIFPEDRQFAIASCETSSKTLHDFEFEYRMLKADGDVIWLRDIVNADIEDGVPQTLRGFMIDITASKRLEETLRKDHDLLAECFEKQSKKLTSFIQKNEESEIALQKADDSRHRADLSIQRLRDFLDAAPDAIVIADEAGVIVFASKIGRAHV
jgi:PAS domain S-box-containing protein